MKRFGLALVIASLALALVPAINASAVQVQPRYETGEDCRDMYLPGYSASQVRACVLLNTNEGPLSGDVEGMVRLRAQTGRSLDFKVDWLHIYRDGFFVTEASQGWNHINADEVGEWDRFSTAWINCPGSSSSFRSVARFKIREHEGPIGDWQKWDSQTVTFGC